MKKCCSCLIDLNESNFYKGYRNCKACHQKSVTKYHKNNKEKISKLQRKYKLKKRYGISLDDYNKMFKSQRGECKICKTLNSKNKNSKKLYVDHCHITKKVRGLLCHDCNVVLGRIKDNKEWLNRALNYLS